MGIIAAGQNMAGSGKINSKLQRFGIKVYRIIVSASSTTKVIEEIGDKWAFMFYTMGIKY